MREYGELQERLYEGAGIGEVLAEFDEYAEAQSKRAPAFYRDRGLARFLAGDEVGALDDFKSALSDDGVKSTDALQILDLVRRSPTSDDPMLYEFLARSGSRIWEDGRKEDWLRRDALRTALYAYHWQGELQKIDSYSAKLGALTNWHVLGPFENVSDSGWNRRFAIEDDFHELRKKQLPIEEKTYIGEDGIECAWFVPPAFFLGTTLTLSDFYPGYCSSVYYATSTLDSRRPQKVTAWLRVSGFFRLWLNGNLVAENPVRASTDLVQRIPLKLGPGENLLVLKIGGGGFDAGFGMSFCDAGGKALTLGKGFKKVRMKNPGALIRSAPRMGMCDNTSTLQDQFSLRLPCGVPLAPTFREHLLALSLDPEQSPSEWPEGMSAAEAFWKGIGLIKLGELAHRFASACLERWPSSGPIHYLHYLTLVETGRYDRLFHGTKCMYELDPSSQIFRYVYAHRLARQRLYKRAAEVLKEGETVSSLGMQITRERPALNPPLAYLLYSCLDEIESEDEQAQVLAYMGKAWPKSPTIALLKALGALERFEREEAVNLLETSLKLNPTNETNALTLLGLVSHDTKKALAQLGSMHRFFPTKEWAIGREISQLMRIGEDSKHIIQLVEQASENFPLSENWLELLSRYYLTGHYYLKDEGETGERIRKLKGKAINFLTAILDRNPNRADIEEKRLRLQNVTPVWETLPEHNVEEFLSSAPDHNAYESEHGVILLREMRRMLLTRESTRMEYFLVGKIFTKTGAERYKSIGVPRLHPGLQRLKGVEILTLKANGEIREGRMRNGRALFHDLGVGDLFFIHLDILGTPFLENAVQDEFLFQTGLPVIEASYVLISPDIEDVNLQTMDYSVDASREFIAPYYVHEWTLRDLPAAELEPFAPPGNRQIAQVEFSTLGEWREVVDWYQRLSGNRTLANQIIIDQVAELTAGKSTEEAKIRALYGYVCNEVVYEDLAFQYSAYIPEPADRVLAAGMGDCKDKAALLISMLREIGVDADFVLAAPSSWQGYFDMPSFYFNHVFVLARPSEGDSLWLDPTGSGNTYTHLAGAYQGGLGLVINRNTIQTTTLPYQVAQEVHHCEGTLELDVSGEATLSVTHRLHGDLARFYRRILLGETDKSTRRVLEYLLNGRYGNLSLLEYDFSDPNELGDEWTLSYKVRLARCVSAEGGSAFLHIPNLLYYDYAYDFPLLEDRRNGPLVIDEFGSETAKLDIVLPGGVSVGLKPEPVNLSGGTGMISWSRLVKEPGRGRLAISWTGSIRPTRLQADDVADFRCLSSRIRAAQESPILLEGAFR